MVANIQLLKEVTWANPDSSNGEIDVTSWQQDCRGQWSRMGGIIMTICAVCQSGSSLSFGIAFPHLYYPLSYALPEARTPAGLYFSVSAAPFPLLHKYLLSRIECKNTSKKIMERASREWNSDSCSIDNFYWISYLNTCSIQANKTIRFF